MTRRQTLRLLSYLGIKAFETCSAELGDWCVWSEYPRAIGNRLTNNERYFGPNDLYVHKEDKDKIEAEYEKRRRAEKAKKEKKATRSNPRYYICGHLRVDIIEFV